MTDKQGVVALILNPAGDVVSTYSDFDRQGYGGFTKEEAQRIRANDAVKREFVRNHLNDWLGSNVDGYFADQFWKNAERAGYKMEFASVGWEEK